MQQSPSNMASEALALATLSPLVIASRLTGLWFDAYAPTTRWRREAMLMVSEKVQAFNESLVAMQLTALRMGLDYGMAPATPASGPDLLRDLDRLVTAGLHPYVVKVRENRRRLAH
ncbi:hypothetical protein [Aureimonas endophytica]|nr:hypothetical protein [Aureimonas endophytica]